VVFAWIPQESIAYLQSIGICFVNLL